MIPRLDIERDAERFLTEFYARDEPVLFPDVRRVDESAGELGRALGRRIAADPGVIARGLWHAVRADLMDPICAAPPLVRSLMQRDDIVVRDECVRVWYSTRGHATPWHYDGNAVSGFNLQLKGSKRWIIVSPDDPLTCMPFSNRCLFDRHSLRRTRHYEFHTHEGDLLFLPRFWFHHVVSEGDLNLNVNWVFTPRTPPAASAVARREAELLWMRDRLYPLMRPRTREYVDHFAGEGRAAVRRITRDVSSRSGWTRIAKEAAMGPFFVLSLPAQIPRIRALRRAHETQRRFGAGGAGSTAGGG